MNRVGVFLCEWCCRVFACDADRVHHECIREHKHERDPNTHTYGPWDYPTQTQPRERA